MKLGILGGMGPMATVYFTELLVRMTKASCDSDHLEMVIYNIPTIPDRTSYIIGKSEESPLPKMKEILEQMKKQKVDYVAIPCMTAHYFYDELSKSGVPIIHALRETAMELKRQGISKVGLMATDGTISSKVFQNILGLYEIETVIPDEIHQKKVMSIIYDEIKAGIMPTIDEFWELKEYFLQQEGAQMIILGCTELSLIKKEYNLGKCVIDTLDVLAKKSLEMCGKEVIS